MPKWSPYEAHMMMAAMTALGNKLEFLEFDSEAVEFTKKVAEYSDRVKYYGWQTAYFTARLQLAARRANVRGPSQELLEEAEAAAEGMSKRGSRSELANNRRIVAKMRARLGKRAEAAHLLSFLRADAVAHGRHLEEFYLDAMEAKQLSDRDQARAEAMFVDLLRRARSRGLKRDEPGIYADYAGFLAKAGRPGDAIGMYHRSLEMHEAFGWFTKVPRLMMKLAYLHESLGNPAQANSLYRRTLALMERHEDMPDKLVLEVLLWKVEFAKWRARPDDAKRHYAELVKFAAASSLSKFQQRILDVYELDGPSTIASVARASAKQVPAIDLQPMTMQTRVEPGEVGRGRFTLSNPTAEPVEGILAALGVAGEVAWDGDEGIWNVVTDSPPVVDPALRLEQPVELDPGEQIQIVIEANSAGEVVASEQSVSIQWSSGGEEAPLEGTWKFAADSAAGEVAPTVAVVNASRARRNPFYTVPFYHEIYFRSVKRGEQTANIRAVAKPACRIEIVTDGTGEFVAIDANGDGVFDGRGDSVFNDSDNDGMPDIQADSGKVVSIELHVYPGDRPDGSKPGDEEIRIELQVEEGEVWVPHATDVLE